MVCIFGWAQDFKMTFRVVACFSLANVKESDEA